MICVRLLVLTTVSLLLALINVQCRADDFSVLVETESFQNLGGWKLDTQFIGEMGSPYLLAHGLGQPVKDAQTVIKFPKPGEYNVFVRTRDWVARWNAKGAPGRFQLQLDGKILPHVFGSSGSEWNWEDGGSVSIKNPETELALKDLTGFDGRCDAIYFTTGTDVPPNGLESLATWRIKKLGLDQEPEKKTGYDLVVVGGGYSGMGAAISAARMGCKVALIQDRGVLGGNGSSEVRVWANGEIRRGKFPRIGEIVYEFADHASKSPGTYEEFEDQKKENIVRAEKNIDLFLLHHAYQVSMDGHRIKSITAINTRTSERQEFFAPLFVDCTGHGTIGWLAGAKFDMTSSGRMGMSNMWAWAEQEGACEFPDTPWALDLNMEDFPYPRDFHGQWFWESGFDKDPLNDAEGIRDWNLRAVFGAFNAMKNRDGRDKHKKAVLTWVAYIGGPRESRRLLGDVLLTKEDIVEKLDFHDGCVPSTWSIDLHYPKEQFAKKFPDNPFISKAEFDHSVDRTFGYPIPYRCFYSANIENLFMAGRCISVTHEALGTTRVMKTCGMMGEVVGKAASICKRHSCSPREVYQQYWAEMEELLNLPGKAYRNDVNSPFVMPETLLPIQQNLAIQSLEGIVVDDSIAQQSGGWQTGGGLSGFVGDGYLWSTSKKSKIEFSTGIREAGVYDVRLSWVHHENRASNVPVTLIIGKARHEFTINMQEAPNENSPFRSLGEFTFGIDQTCGVILSAEGTNGYVCADAVQIVKVEK